LKKEEFSRIRSQLDKTQKQMAQLLGTSLKAVQSFEQGWRKIPVHIERQMLFLLAHSDTRGGTKGRCWNIRKCPVKKKRQCPAWEFQLGHLCWFINGTICEGEPQKSWEKKMKHCRKCRVFQSLLPMA
jgi:hypothetical protein